MKFKSITALLLALLMVFSLAACGNNDTTTTTEPESEGNTTEGPQTNDVAMSYFNLSTGENYDNIYSISAYPNEDGTIHVEYTGAEKKVGDLPSSVWATIAEAFDASGLKDLNGQEAYEEGEANGSLYVTYTDESMVSAGFSGVIPEAFTAGYAAMDECFKNLTADLPVYVPQPIVQGELADSDKVALDAILENMEIPNLDSFMISGVAKDEYFATIMGLSSYEGIASGLTFAPMMMTTAYSMAIVTLEDGTSTDTVAADFVSSIDWTKWVCVAPSNAIVAVKDNQVLCVMGSETLFTASVSGVEAAGWTVVNTLENDIR